MAEVFFQRIRGRNLSHAFQRLAFSAKAIWRWALIARNQGEIIHQKNVFTQEIINNKSHFIKLRKECKYLDIVHELINENITK